MLSALILRQAAQQLLRDALAMEQAAAGGGAAAAAGVGAAAFGGVQQHSVEAPPVASEPVTPGTAESPLRQESNTSVTADFSDATRRAVATNVAPAEAASMPAPIAAPAEAFPARALVAAQTLATAAAARLRAVAQSRIRPASALAATTPAGGTGSVGGGKAAKGRQDSRRRSRGEGHAFEDYDLSSDDEAADAAAAARRRRLRRRWHAGGAHWSFGTRRLRAPTCRGCRRRGRCPLPFLPATSLGAHVAI